jgi:hypothetical protein
MIRSEKKLSELRKVIESNVHNAIRDRISLLRENEPFEGSIMVLASFYNTTKDNALRQLITDFFNDIKERSARAEIIEALLSPLSNETKRMIASSCWQSGLDYSENAAALAGIYLGTDYLTALECFTILEVSSDDIPPAEKKSIIRLLEKELVKQDSTMQQLTQELISVLKK